MKTATAVLFCFLALPAMAEVGQFHYVKSLQAEVRAEPSDSAKVKVVVAKGRKLVEFDRKGGFAQVGVDKSGGLDGWVKLEQLAATDPDGVAY